MSAGKTIAPVPGNRVRHTKFDRAATVVAPLTTADGLVSLSRTPLVPDGDCTVRYWETRHLELEGAA